MNWYETEVGHGILSKKYFHEDEKTYPEMVDRIAKCFPDKMQNQLKEYLMNGDFFFGGRSLYALGCKGKFTASTSNCYTLPSPSDNLESIMDVGKQMAVIFSKGGGVGINLSNLRPKGAKVNNVAKTSTGAVSFMELYNTIGGIISQNGRRGALLLGLSCEHPDLEDFLRIKQDNTSIQSANISVLFTDDFMEAVKNDWDWELKFETESGEVIKKKIKALDFFREFCQSNLDYGEPGAIFIDRVRKYNLMSADADYKIEICNPCGEFFAKANNSCNLGSINLYNFVKNPFTSEAEIDYLNLSRVTDFAVEALDIVLDYGYDLQPLDANREDIKNYRSIGLGIFGLADMLVAMGQKYGSPESLQTISEVMRVISQSAVETTHTLAIQKGSFGKYKDKIVFYNEYLDYVHPHYYKGIECGFRNSNLLSIAPTGSISTMIGVTGGIEPIYQIAYERSTHSMVNEGKFFKVYAKSVQDLLKHHGINPDTVTIDEIKAKFPFVVDAYDINPLDRVLVQSEVQKYVDNAISSTVNMKQGTTLDEVMRVYMEAWELGCKGVTVFVEGCKRTAILGKTEETKAAEVIANDISLDSIEPQKRNQLNSISPVKRSTMGKTNGITDRRSTACCPSIYVTVNKNDNGDIVECFTSASQGCQSNLNTINRLISLALRSGVKVSEITKEMKSNYCPACALAKQQGKDVEMSCGIAIANVIEEEYNMTNVNVARFSPEKKSKCPQCGEETLQPTGKCVSCFNCGWSKCE